MGVQDLFDQADMIPSLKSQGHTVICYFSAGSWEAWRPDANDTAWASVKIGKCWGGFAIAARNAPIVIDYL